METLSACGWRHDRIAAAYARLPADPDIAFERVAAQLEETGASGVLLLGASAADGFVVEMRARNRCDRASRGADRSRRIAPTGPASARATAPVADLARALTSAGLCAVTASEGADDGLNHLLYRLLSEAVDEAGAPSIGALRLPAGGASEADAVQRGLCAALLAFADTLGSSGRGAMRPTA